MSQAHALHSTAPETTKLKSSQTAFSSHLYPVVTRFSRFILAEDGPVLLALPLHLHPERPLRPPDPHCQLACTCPSGVADEPTLVPEKSKCYDYDLSGAKNVPSQHTMLNTRSVDADLSRVRSPRHSKLERRPRHMVPSVLK